jgi:hypothetical protein
MLTSYYHPSAAIKSFLDVESSLTETSRQKREVLKLKEEI